MASLPTNLQQHQGAHDGEDPGPVVATQQLAEKTSLLTLSMPGSEEMLPDGNPSVTHAARPPASAQPDSALALSTPFSSTTVDAPSNMEPSIEHENHDGINSGGGSSSSSNGDAEQEAVVLESNVSRGDFCQLPNEVLLHILSYLEVCDLLATSRTSHHLRTLSLSPHLHRLRLRSARSALPIRLASPSRPTLPDLIRRSIFLTNTTIVSRRLARSFVSIRLSRQLAARPAPEVLVERCVLPAECLPGKKAAVAPALVARKRAVERERVKDRLRGFVGSVWGGKVREKEEGVKQWEERSGVGRVWRLTRFWEGVGREQR
ncbi:hypothetical protein QBC40DRAFT_330380 [Triangularia verruculosa]|uniref:F-box domain-containing protein n=1 Tax=Triangularia verruculosa TaxID=2587418 RepID=A0AAN6XHK0_9PEZI|nr:hypothetical protein QBC40DRAFT_330380 [Triangularia verruculosa]